MRGTPADIPRNPRQTGIIPAYAGNTFHMTSIMVHRRDHPRVCGEHTQTVPPTTSGAGSSPRMRGTRPMTRLTAHTTGIIPAYAGNTSMLYFAHKSQQDHPRVCGEHSIVDTLQAFHVGSSPRMRGTHCTDLVLLRWFGIIPAYAGNTRESLARLIRAGDHPRVCGEHELFDCRFIRGRGSSPRMRGTPPTTRTRRMRPGIIPAYAGNTRHIFNLPKSLVDHPRVCGEHPYVILRVRIFAGSSPRMRGTRGVM